MDSFRSSTVAFGYDSNFRTISESVNSANSISFGYDNDDLLTSAGALALRRDAGNGLLTGTTLSNLVDTYGYNSFGEVTSYGVQLSIPRSSHSATRATMPAASRRRPKP